MLGLKEQFEPLLKAHKMEAICPEFTQTMSEEALCEILPNCDGWIIGDDPATEAVFSAGKQGLLKAVVKWGIGVDNVDFKACEKLGIPITNTPFMFGEEVADIAIGYMIGLARETYLIDRKIRLGEWPKNRGISLRNKNVGIVGYGDIGQQIVKRLHNFGLNITVYDPAYDPEIKTSITFQSWPQNIDKLDFLVFACSLNEKNRHMLNEEVFSKCKKGIRIVNVARGPLICETDLVDAIDNNIVHSAALDVFEDEPLSCMSPLHQFEKCIFGSHNSSNTYEAVARTNALAIEKLVYFLNNI